MRQVDRALQSFINSSSRAVHVVGADGLLFDCSWSSSFSVGHSLLILLLLRIGLLRGGTSIAAEGTAQQDGQVLIECTDRQREGKRVGG